jgi:hypothetical protein
MENKITTSRIIGGNKVFKVFISSVSIKIATFCAIISGTQNVYNNYDAFDK